MSHARGSMIAMNSIRRAHYGACKLTHLTVSQLRRDWESIESPSGPGALLEWDGMSDRIVLESASTKSGLRSNQEVGLQRSSSPLSYGKMACLAQSGV